MKNIFAVLPLSVIAAVACQSAPSAQTSAQSASASSPASANSDQAKTTAAATSAAPTTSATGARNIPGIDLACASDAECVTFDEVLTGKEACCPGCTWNVGNKTSVDAFHAACTKSPANECPALGCMMAITTAKCVAGKCTGVVKH